MGLLTAFPNLLYWTAHTMDKKLGHLINRVIHGKRVPSRRFEKGVCPYCFKEVRAGNTLDEHIKVCARLPTAEEVAEILDSDEKLTITALCHRFGVHPSRITGRLANSDTGWSMDRIRERGLEARATRRHGDKNKEGRIDYVNGRYPCANKCGLLVEKEGYYCKFCVLDANGIRDLNDIRFKDNSDELIRVLRCDEDECFESLKAGI